MEMQYFLWGRNLVTADSYIPLGTRGICETSSSDFPANVLISLSVLLRFSVSSRKVFYKACFDPSVSLWIVVQCTARDWLWGPTRAPFSSYLGRFSQTKSG
jgi:hypothetical protein